MNASASHEVPRLASSVYNQDFYELQAQASQNAHPTNNQPDATTRQKQKVLLLQQLTYVGAPHIYGGDEMGMWGVDYLDNRKPLIWPEINFNSKSEDPLGLSRPDDLVHFDTSFFQYYRDLIKMRRQYQSLQKERLLFLGNLENNGLLAYERFWEDERLLCIFNNTSEDRR